MIRLKKKNLPNCLPPRWMKSEPSSNDYSSCDIFLNPYSTSPSKSPPLCTVAFSFA